MTHRLANVRRSLCLVFASNILSAKPYFKRIRFGSSSFQAPHPIAPCLNWGRVGSSHGQMAGEAVEVGA